MRIILGAFLLSLSTFVYADFSTPAGIWDIQGIAVVRSKFSDEASKVAPKASVYGFVQFREDGAYTTIPWLNNPGRWQILSGNKRVYQTSFDLNAVSSGQTRPPFLNAMLSQYLGLVKKKYSKVKALKAMKVESYTDRGKLVKKGMRIAGTLKMRASVTFVDPDTQRDVMGGARMTLVYRGTRASAPSICCSSNDAARNQADSAAFLAENAKLPGVKMTASGLQYLILRNGEGKSPGATDKVTVDYRGILPSGQYFDSGSGVSFSLSNVIAGFSEGLRLLKEGAYYRLYVPPELAYGATGSGATIKPNAALIFDVVLSKVN